MISQDEEKILNSINVEEIDRIIKTATKIPSSPPMGEEQELAEYFGAELESLGVEIELQRRTPQA